MWGVLVVEICLMWGSKDNLGVLVLSFLPRGLFSTVQAILAHELLEIVLCLPPIFHRRVGLQTHYYIQLFTWVLGFRTRVLAGAVSAFIHWDFSPAQEADFKPWNLHSLECFHVFLFQLAARQESLLPGCLPKRVSEVQPVQPEQRKETVEERDKISLFADKD